MEKIIMNSIGSPFTLDMYCTFITESAEEYHIEIFNEEHNTNLSYDSFEWTYDMDSIHKELAECWKDYVLEHFPELIKDISIISLHRPKYYNYTTDSADFELTVDTDFLDSFIDKNKESYIYFTYPREYNLHYSSDPLNDTLEKVYFYMHTKSEKENLEDNYIIDTFEKISETMYNAITME